MTSAIKTFFKRFARDTRGSILIVAAFAASGLIAVGGSAYDFGMQQMAWKNSQFAGDMAATSAAGARMSEQWGRGSSNPSIKAQQLDHQKRLVEMYYRINNRGFDVDPSFTLTEISVVEQGDVFRTVVRGEGTIPANFVKMVGVSELPYAIETVTNLQNPGAQPTYDMALVLDFTKSMEKNMAGCDGAACTRASALQRASTFLNNIVMCGNEAGTPCLERGDEEGANNNRVGVIPYGLTAVGLDPCDLAPGDPERPAYCICIMPRASTGYSGTMEDWTNNNQFGYTNNGDGTVSGPGEEGMPDDPCRPRCSWIDSQGRPASDPESDVFSCECFDPENSEYEIPPPGDTPVLGGPCGANMRLDSDAYPEALASCSFLNFCTDGGCCPPKCIPGSSGPGRCDAAPGSRACAECQARAHYACGCAQPTGEISCGDDNETPDLPGDDEDCSMVLGPVPPQTYACHHASCTCSCTASGSPSELPPCGGSGANPEQGCTPHSPPPPWPPGGRPSYGMNQPLTPQAQFAAAVGVDEATLFSALYRPEENGAKLIMTSTPDGAWGAFSLMDCLDAGTNQLCNDGVQAVIDAEPTEGDTNSAAAFEAFERHTSYLNFMRPSVEEPDTDAMNVIVWVSDGENNSFKYPSVNGQAPVIIPREERVEGTAAGCRPNIYEPAAPCNDRVQDAGTADDPGPDWQAVIDNCYDSAGTFRPRPNGAISGDCPSGTRTAQGWSDYHTLQQCTKFRTGNWATSTGEPRPITIYSVYVHDGSDADALAHTRELMSTCSYGQAVGTSEEPPAGQQRLFFSVTTVEQLNRTFRTISNSLGRIRIVD